MACCQRPDDGRHGVRGRRLALDERPVHRRRFRRNLAVVRDLTGFAARRDATVAQLAIAWTLANPAVDVAIVGARSAEQIRQTAPAADLRLTPEDIAQIESLLRGEVAVGGPAPEAMPKS